MTQQAIGTVYPDLAIDQDVKNSVNREHIIIDGDREKEVVRLSPTAGASSEAPANSGIPSAVTQHRLRSEATTPQQETTTDGRLLPVVEDSKP
jgi:hypothetical protein